MMTIGSNGVLSSRSGRGKDIKVFVMGFAYIFLLGIVHSTGQGEPASKASSSEPKPTCLGTTRPLRGVPRGDP